MFNDRDRIQIAGGTATREQLISDLYAQHAAKIQRLVARHADGDVQDACQTAWERLLTHPEVDLNGQGVIRWLVITATREAWKRSPYKQELPFSGVGTEDGAFDRAASTANPLTVVLERDDARRRLGGLTDRERRYLALKSLGLSYAEIAHETGTTIRTVERQLLRARRKLQRADQR
jgi:RNA polymerase sigma factor (sigma-70 family)